MKSLIRQFALYPVLALLLLGGCRVGPKYTTPPATATAPPTAYKESPTQFPDTGGWKVAQPQDAMLHGKWWEIYEEPELSALEEQVNINNQTIRASFENFMEARAIVAQARAQLYPTLGTTPTYNRSRSSGNLRNSASANTGATSSIGSLPLSASWEPDLFGRIRNTIREYQYNAQVSAADLENQRLLEQASLAVYFFELRGQDALRAIYDQTIAEDKRSLEYTQAQYETGVGDRISVVEAENTLENAQSVAINLGVARAQYEHAIALLVGTSASGFSIPVRPLLKTPPPIPVGVPSQLLERRPDIAAAERNMASANAQIGVADAAFYPTVTLSASGGLESSTFKHLFDINSRFWSIGPSISETIYDAGLRRATVNQFIALYNADVANYRQTVLVGFQQVEDNLSAVRILSDQIREQELAQKSAEEFVALELGRYETGIDPYVNVVTAQTTLLSDRQTLASLHVQQMTASVQLIEALGGGWDVSQLPTTQQITKKLTKGETVIDR